MGDERMATVGVIGGSGFYDLDGVEVKETTRVQTPYGDPSDAYRICDLSGVEVAFLARHGTPHRIPPHRINYRANVWGFRELGVERILSVNAVGGITAMLRPGTIVIPDQILDKTSGRNCTFYEGEDVVHIDFTDPLCVELRRAISRAAAAKGVGLEDHGTYVCVNGPRLETRAEIEYFSGIGADLVGMTIMPEAVLARELGLCFSAIAVVTNYAAGISGKRLTTAEVFETMRGSMDVIRSLIAATLQAIPSERGCDCSKLLNDARM